MVKYQCEPCSKTFSHIDDYFRHINLHKNYNLIPFAKDKIDCLSLTEKIKIFNLDNVMAIIETLIVYINLDYKKTNNHNFFYKNIKNDYGMIYNGEKWIKKRINKILQILCDARKQNLWDIYEEIQFYLPNNIKNKYKNVLDNIDNILRPNDEIGQKNKKSLFTNIKKYMIDHYELGEDAMLNIIFNANNNIDKRFPGTNYTIDQIERHIKLTKLIKERNNLTLLLGNNTIKINSEISIK